MPHQQMGERDYFMDMENKYLILIASWVLYLALHSLLASAAVKQFIQKNLSFLYAGYRFIYSLLSAFSLMAILYLMAFMPTSYLFPIDKTVQYIGMVLAVWGVMVLVASFRKLSGLAFLGLRKPSTGQLVKEGVHGKVRHPIYSGTILIFIGMFLYSPTDVVLISVCINLLYLPLGIYWEEQKLIQEFGEDYKQYKKEVPAIIPRLF